MNFIQYINIPETYAAIFGMILLGLVCMTIGFDNTLLNRKEISAIERRSFRIATFLFIGSGLVLGVLMSFTNR